MIHLQVLQKNKLFDKVCLKCQLPWCTKALSSYSLLWQMPQYHNMPLLFRVVYFPVHVTRAHIPCIKTTQAMFLTSSNTDIKFPHRTDSEPCTLLQIEILHTLVWQAEDKINQQRYAQQPRRKLQSNFLYFQNQK